LGQYFKACDPDKHEYVCPWYLSGFAKLWEWAANPWGAIFTMLLRQSSASGGGDYYGPATREVHLGRDAKDSAELFVREISKGLAMAGRPVTPPRDTTVGRWAGDRVALVGDYDDSKLWKQLPCWRNISKEVARDWNAFIEIDRMKLTYDPDCSCNKDR
jgi:hypothetical protein